MHTNHRRRNKFNGKHHNKGPWHLAHSLAEDKAVSARQRRAQLRYLLVNGRYDEVSVRYPRDIYWNYW